jgi:hypothetical protein
MTSLEVAKRTTRGVGKLAASIIDTVNNDKYIVGIVMNESASLIVEKFAT